MLLPKDPADFSGAIFNDPVCPRCDDFRRIDAPPGLSDADDKPIRSVPCPACGTDAARREAFRLRARLPELQRRDLKGEDLDLFDLWFAQGHHELDCLRWIEGRHYLAAKDKPFMRQSFELLAAWSDARDKHAAARRSPQEARSQATPGSSNPTPIAPLKPSSQEERGVHGLSPDSSIAPRNEESTTYAKTPEKANENEESGPW